MKNGQHILFLIFLILKLTGIMDWSWWIVTCPLWLPLVIVFTLIIGIIGLTIGFAIIFGVTNYIKNKK